MIEQEIQTELIRLHDIVFEGAPEWVRAAVVSTVDKSWYWVSTPNLISSDGEGWLIKVHYYRLEKSNNQPETFLDWTQTLIERKP